MNANKKILYIEWEDAVANNSDVWRTSDEVIEWAKSTNFIIKQIGFLIRETKKEIVLAGHCHDGGDEWEPQFGQLQKIPKTWIRKRKVIKL